MTTFKLFATESPTTSIRVGSRLGKYRITKRLGEGGFATVYAAMDTIEGRRVAVKIPDARFVSNTQSAQDLHREVRIMAKLEHPGILQLKDATYIDGRFLMVFPLGEESLGDRLSRRMSRVVAVDYLVQMVDAVAFAHERNVLHRDIKPENFILFSDRTIRLTDFGLARLETTDHFASGSGTLGYMSPEQAMGQPNFRSDVFSLGLVMYQVLSGELPEYPFEAPLPGYNRLRRGISTDLVALIRKAIDPQPRKRFRDASAMSNALAKIRYPLTDRSVSQRVRPGSAPAERSTRHVA
ncbi:MAG: serine/threonine-protein kinase [Planctomycetota bacterium]